MQTDLERNIRTKFDESFVTKTPTNTKLNRDTFPHHCNPDSRAITSGMPFPLTKIVRDTIENVPAFQEHQNDFVVVKGTEDGLDRLIGNGTHMYKLPSCDRARGQYRKDKMIIEELNHVLTTKKKSTNFSIVGNSKSPKGKQKM